MHTTKQPPTESRIASAQIITDPVTRGRRLGLVRRLILDHDCWKQIAAQAGSAAALRSSPQTTGAEAIMPNEQYQLLGHVAAPRSASAT